MKTTIELLQTVKNIIGSHADKLTNNETLTRYSLIDPILRHLGWDIANPEEVVPEYTIEKKISDYAIFKDKSKKPHIFIEAKSLNRPLEDKSQIGNYIGNSTARFVIFTDGAKWKLFDFHIQAKDDANERIVLDIDILNEPDNISAIKIHCLSKENLFSDNPFFTNHKITNSSNNFSEKQIEKISSPTINKNSGQLTVIPGMFEYEKDEIFYLKTNPSVKIDVSKPIREVKEQLKQNGLFNKNIGSFRDRLKRREELL